MSLIIILCHIMKIWSWITVSSSCVKKWMILINYNNVNNTFNSIYVYRVNQYYLILSSWMVFEYQKHFHSVHT